jgi:hypothetical protein
MSPLRGVRWGAGRHTRSVRARPALTQPRPDAAGARRGRDPRRRCCGRRRQRPGQRPLPRPRLLLRPRPLRRSGNRWRPPAQAVRVRFTPRRACRRPPAYSWLPQQRGCCACWRCSAHLSANGRSGSHCGSGSGPRGRGRGRRRVVSRARQLAHAQVATLPVLQLIRRRSRMVHAPSTLSHVHAPSTLLHVPCLSCSSQTAPHGTASHGIASNACGAAQRYCHRAACATPHIGCIQSRARCCRVSESATAAGRGGPAAVAAESSPLVHAAGDLVGTTAWTPLTPCATTGSAAPHAMAPHSIPRGSAGRPAAPQRAHSAAPHHNRLRGRVSSPLVCGSARPPSRRTRA